MDLNAAATPTIVNSCQQNNQLLLNAIKNKFAAQTVTEAAAFSPPKFDIPLLKIPGATQGDSTNENNKNSDTVRNNTPTTQLNQFLLKQLQDKHTNNGLTKEHKGFVLPQLQSTSNSKGSITIELPILKHQPRTAKEEKISNLTSAINKLQVQEYCDKATPVIDLTTALAHQQTHQGTPPTRDFVKHSQINPEPDFEIPFIDCDRLDVSKKRQILLSTSNEYCVTDISQLMLQHTFVEPSAIGRFLCFGDTKYTAPLPLKCLSTEFSQQTVKHHIEPFRFESKSPDDIVLEALNKYQRRHYN